MGLESIPPGMMEVLYCLEDVVRDQEALAHQLFVRGRETDNAWMMRWMEQHEEWFEMIRKARKALEAYGIVLRYPHESEKPKRPKGVEPMRAMCRSCGTRGKRHHHGCKKASKDK